MKAYSGIVTKKEFIRELKAHRKADNFIRGTYWEDSGKGCAVGCSLESIARIKNLKIDFNDHSKYPELLGIPEWLGRVEDVIFEGLPLERSKNWPIEFSEAIKVGIDLEPLKAKFSICVLRRALTTFDNDAFPDVTASINYVIEFWERSGTEQEFEVARSAESAAWAAWAAWAAAESAATYEYFAAQLLEMIKAVK